MKLNLLQNSQGKIDKNNGWSSKFFFKNSVFILKGIEYQRNWDSFDVERYIPRD